ncbi:MAG TPA: hypothetical protein VF890_01315 [Gemmatimonadales bacterium]
MPKRVYLAARDLVFRAKLGAALAGAGAKTTRDEAACDLAVLDAEAPDALERIRGFVARGIPVLAYGPHVRAELLRAAREAGAVAVPNSRVEETLRELLS